MLHDCGLCKMPDWFPSVLVNLRELSLIGNHLFGLPESFKSLLFLELRSQQEVKGQQAVAYFELEKLNMPTCLESFLLNPVRSIPDCFCSSYTSIKCLEISCVVLHDTEVNKVRVLELPPSIRCMSFLTNLQLQNCGMNALPSTMAGLHHVTDVDLSSNLFPLFPGVLLSLISLKQLDMSLNTITELPEEISKLHQLETLNMSCNQIRFLPEMSENAESGRQSFEQRRSASPDKANGFTRSATPHPCAVPINPFVIAVIFYVDIVVRTKVERSSFSTIAFHP